MIDIGRLLSDLQRVVRDLEADLRGRVAGEPSVRRAWEAEFEAARSSERTGLAFEVWRDQRVTQVAVGWVLACMLTRLCEDNGLPDDVWLSGPGERLAEARDRQLHYGREHLGSSDLDYLESIFVGPTRPMTSIHAGHP